MTVTDKCPVARHELSSWLPVRRPQHHGMAETDNRYARVVLVT